MKFAYTVLAAWGGRVVSALPQNAAGGCDSNYGGPFEITIATASTQKREIRQYEVIVPITSRYHSGSREV